MSIPKVMGEQWVQEKVIGFAHLFTVARAGPFHNSILLDGSFGTPSLAALQRFLSTLRKTDVRDCGENTERVVAKGGRQRLVVEVQCSDEPGSEAYGKSVNCSTSLNTPRHTHCRDHRTLVSHQSRARMSKMKNGGQPIESSI